jgi:hypothetical protein
MKKKQPTVADVLHYAADKCLAHDRRYTADGIKEKFSCCAVTEAIYQLTYSFNADGLYDRVFDGLKAMGCDTGSHTLFKKYGDQPHEYSNVDETVQGMRYMWLKWAALMAEEQGV